MGDRLVIRDLTRSEDGRVMRLKKGFSLTDLKLDARQEHESTPSMRSDQTLQETGAELTLALTRPDVFPCAAEYYLFNQTSQTKTNICLMLPTANLYVGLDTRALFISEKSEHAETSVPVRDFCEKFLLQLKHLAYNHVGQQLGERPKEPIVFSSWSCNIQDWIPLMDLICLKQLICEAFVDTYAGFTCKGEQQSTNKATLVDLVETSKENAVLEAWMEEEAQALLCDEKLKEAHQTANKSSKFSQTFQGEILGLGEVSLSLTLDGHGCLNEIYFESEKFDQGEVNAFLTHLQGKPGNKEFLQDFTQRYADCFKTLFLPKTLGVEELKTYTNDWKALFDKNFSN